jgi:hypothetical protein
MTELERPGGSLWKALPWNSPCDEDSQWIPILEEHCILVMQVCPLLLQPHLAVNQL